MGYFAAAPDRLARVPIEGGIEISREAYKEAIGVLADPGDRRVISIVGGIFSLALPPQPEPDPDPVPELPSEKDYAAAIQFRLDEAARAQGYTDGVSLATYVSSNNAAWAAEARTFVTWRDAVWSYAYAELTKVKNGQRAQPTISELLAELPTI